MSVLDRFLRFLGFGGEPEASPDEETHSYPWLSERPKPPVTFEQLIVVERTPGDSTVSPEEMYSVEYKGKRYWTMFRCPCDCGEVVTLLANAEDGPSWSTNLTAAGRPSLRPSIWRMTGCHSHFWVDDGRVYWCGNSGREPWVAAPDHYEKPTR